MDVGIASLLAADSPRIKGEDLVYARMLAEAETALPPILVHRTTMRVIDGMHRIRAATLRGRDTIEARFFDGDENETFMLAVRANITHGLPLSRADRQAAAARIVISHGHLSDRAIAAVVGLSATTVAAIRRRSMARPGQLNANSGLSARVGLDGKLRPTNPAEGRLRAGEVIAANPKASVREIARAAGISLGTAHDVRQRIRNGLDSLLPGQRAVDPPGGSASVDRIGARRGEIVDWPAARVKLSKDPALRYCEPGRLLMHWLDTHSVGEEEWRRLVPVVPARWRGLVAGMARAFAAEWLELARELEYRDQATA